MQVDVSLKVDPSKSTQKQHDGNPYDYILVIGKKCGILNYKPLLHAN